MQTNLSVSEKYTYEKLQQKYIDFSHPQARVLFGDKAFDSVGKDMIVDDIHVELSSGYEASVASFRLYDSYDDTKSSFKFDQVKKQIAMGNALTIEMGYMGMMETVFVGFISGVAFGFEAGSLPYIEITAMDVKGVMMGGSYATEIAAKSYAEAVKKVLQRTGESQLQRMGGITGMDISETPDGKNLTGGTNKSSPISIEMVSESDYEFVVRAAKRYNYEFFVDRGKVIFRPAKKDTSTLLKMSNRAGLRNFRIEYSITGVVGAIEARAMDPGKGEVISVNKKFDNKISTANKARDLMGKGAKVYLDASITSKQEAESRVASLMEKMSYRLGSLEAECVGIPELVPGRFIEVVDMGEPLNNTFYLTNVTHDFNSDAGFRTEIKACADQIKTTGI